MRTAADIKRIERRKGFTSNYPYLSTGGVGEASAGRRVSIGRRREIECRLHGVPFDGAPHLDFTLSRACQDNLREAGEHAPANQ
jgi:hypothetical protein